MGEHKPGVPSDAPGLCPGPRWSPREREARRRRQCPLEERQRGGGETRNESSDETRVLQD